MPIINVFGGRMSKGITLILIFNLFFNSISSFSRYANIGCEEFEQILKAEAPIIAFSTACILPIEIMKRVLTGQNVSHIPRPDRSEKKEESRKNIPTDFALIAKDEKPSISKYHFQTNKCLYFIAAFKDNLLVNLVLKLRSGPPVRGVFKGVTFFLDYFAILAESNLPEVFLSIKLNYKPDLPRADRVFYLWGLCI